MTVSNINELPPEVLIDIFWSACDGPQSLCLLNEPPPDDEPFSRERRGFLFRDPLNGTDLQDKVNPAWKTKLAIPLVCKLWNIHAAPIVYKDLYIGSHCDAILERFERSRLEDDPTRYLGSYVRRIILNATHRGVKPLRVSNLLALCPRAHSLIKNDSDGTPPSGLDDFDMSPIQRFEWRYVGHRGSMWDRRHLTDGLDFFREVCSRATKLQYLSIGMTHPNSRVSRNPPRHITLSSLTMLVLRHIGRDLRQEMETFFHLPSLKHLVTDSCLIQDGRGFSPIFSETLLRLEFFGDPSLQIYGTLGVIQRCPNLQELSFFAETCTFPMGDVAPHHSLECIRLNINPTGMMSSTDAVMFIVYLLKIFCGPSFPNLRRLVFYGDWSPYEQDPEIDTALNNLKENGRQVEYIEEQNFY